jgi:hypothetical protein
MRVNVRLCAVPGKVVLMFVMDFVPMGVVVHLCLVGVQVVVSFGQVQRHTRRHQRCCPPKSGTGGFAQPYHRDRCTHKWCS